MKIGIDGKWFFNGPVSGRVVLQNLLPYLFQNYPQHEWHIFLDKHDQKKRFAFTGGNIHVHYVWAGMNMISSIWILPRYARKLRLDIVIYQNFAGLTKKIRSIAFIHDLLFEDYPQFFTWKERLYFKPMKYYAQKADRVMTTTDFVRKDILRFNYARTENLDLVPLGVSDTYRPLAAHHPSAVKRVREKYDLPEKYLLFVGRLNVRKNIENLLRSIPFINDKKIPLLIVGSREWKAPVLGNLLADETIKNRVFFTGSVSDEDLVVIYAAAALFCFPSLAEGFGLPPIEAMASGIPVIVSNTTALPEVCGAAGNYIDPLNPNQIAGMINELLEKKDLYEQKKQAGLDRASELNWTNTAKKFMTSVENCMKS